ncbi:MULTISPECIES: acetate CoA-transferase subunit alpha [Snodgrassella]|uniref:Acetate CoA-transferase subunit alpha n=2 Tax=Snodgrassella alvi TaxID=1196083 RepID=A0A1X0TKT0_9NEIS|nr:MULTISPECIES: acetate CoA-transferase subunit alpha [Snodgrassella]KEQ01413.1 Acyl CoA:acetate/3-ketoacid CoA transferase, alpha subunit [Snodgrassella alvi SCGC AB-598-J21]KES10374.1 Acyl CoA:acetate/3-ketoacid CoA transferase, alpha subunit [Snodgrassella alvi SCGC AB-598-O11]AHN27717.1 Acetyl-CoA:acetoacetyl-CoA transferase, alpha subunit [Snodgrassella alvi wkB2]MBI0066785.1 acetate CoA-transferase subunit alpha [Snodgrassella sp. M0110]MBI0076296.1 acetate CoA-transferase subunit alpha
MKTKQLSLADVKNHLWDGMTIMFGGFMGIGTPARLVQAILDSGVKDLTIIGNDTAFVETGVGPLITNNRVKKVITSHIGTNPETGKKMIAGEIEVELVPQGTLAERIRAAGAGLGGVLTPTGLGTIVEEGKQKIAVNGQEYLLELPLQADLAIVEAKTADKLGNLVYELSAQNFNPLVALAAKKVIVEAGNVVEVGEISPDAATTPAALVDYIVYPE